MVAPLQHVRVTTSKEHDMIELALTARGLYVRLQFAPETLVVIVILARLLQRHL